MLDPLRPSTLDDPIDPVEGEAALRRYYTCMFRDGEAFIRMSGASRGTTTSAQDQNAAEGEPCSDIRRHWLRSADHAR